MAFYIKPPSGLVPLNKLQNFVMKRLAFLYYIHNHSVEDVFKIIINESLAVNSECLIEGTVKDKISHFTLRLLCISSSTLEDFFIQNETKLFIYRLQFCDISRIQQMFKKACEHSRYILCNNEYIFNYYEQVLKSFVLVSEELDFTIKNNKSFIKVPFTTALKFVKERTYPLHLGFIRLPVTDLKSLCVCLFEELLVQGIHQVRKSHLKKIPDPRMLYISQKIMNLLWGCFHFCNYSATLWTEEVNDYKNINITSAAVAGIVKIGGGFSNLEEFLSTLNISPMSVNTFIQQNDKISDAWESTSLKEMEIAANIEKKLAIERGAVDLDGIPLLTIVDGSCAKRSYKTSYASLSGVKWIHSKLLPVKIPSNKFLNGCNLMTLSNKFPLCMRNLHSLLLKHHRLKHVSRIQFILFLKEIGVPSDDVIKLFRKEYSLPFFQTYDVNHAPCSHNWAESENKYIYSIEHLYGKRGARKNYKAHSCYSLQNSYDSEGGCPFVSFDNHHLQIALKSENLMVKDIEDIASLVEENKHHEACCCYLRCKINMQSVQQNGFNNIATNEEQNSCVSNSKNYDFKNNEKNLHDSSFPLSLFSIKKPSDFYSIISSNFE